MSIKLNFSSSINNFSLGSTKLSQINNFLQKKVFDFDLLLALRGLACLSVIFFHAYVTIGDIGKSKPLLLWWPFALNGDTSVLVFFILSGYLMAKLFDIQKYNVSKVGLKKFYLARILRIMPLYWVVLFFGGTIVNTRFLNSGKVLDFVRSMFFMQYTTTRLFLDTDHRWLMVAWTLVVEMQFYLVAPFLIAAILKFIKPLWLQIISFAGLLSLMYNNVLLKTGERFFQDVRFPKTVLPYLPFFLVGSFCVLFLKNDIIRKNLQKYTWVLFIVFPAIFLVPMINKLDPSIVLSKWENIVVAISACSIILIYESFSYAKKPAAWNYSPKQYLNPKTWLEVLGHLSYGAYLWHVLIMFTVGAGVVYDDYARFGLTFDQFQYLRFLYVVIVTFLVSAYTYHSVEKFGMKLKFKKLASESEQKEMFGSTKPQLHTQ